jgi:hypothetical protein
MACGRKREMRWLIWTLSENLCSRVHSTAGVWWKLKNKIKGLKRESSWSWVSSQCPFVWLEKSLQQCPGLGNSSDGWQPAPSAVSSPTQYRPLSGASSLPRGILCLRSPRAYGKRTDCSFDQVHTLKLSYWLLWQKESSFPNCCHLFLALQEAHGIPNSSLNCTTNSG